MDQPRIDFQRAHRNCICLLAGLLAPLVTALTKLMEKFRLVDEQLGRRCDELAEVVETCRYECAENNRLTDFQFDLIGQALRQLDNEWAAFHALSDELADIRGMLTELLFYGDATIHQPEAWMMGLGVRPPPPWVPPPPRGPRQGALLRQARLLPASGLPEGGATEGRRPLP